MKSAFNVMIDSNVEVDFETYYSDCEEDKLDVSQEIIIVRTFSNLIYPILRISFIIPQMIYL